MAFRFVMSVMTPTRIHSRLCAGAIRHLFPQPDRPTVDDGVKLLLVAGRAGRQRPEIVRMHRVAFGHLQWHPVQQGRFARVGSEQPTVKTRGGDVEPPVELARSTLDHASLPQQTISSLQDVTQLHLAGPAGLLILLSVRDVPDGGHNPVDRPDPGAAHADLAQKSVPSRRRQCQGNVWGWPAAAFDSHASADALSEGATPLHNASAGAPSASAREHPYMAHIRSLTSTMAPVSQSWMNTASLTEWKID